MNKFVSILAALAVLSCASAQTTFNAFTPRGSGYPSTPPPLINQLAMPVRPPPPPPFLGGFGFQPQYLPPTIIEHRVRYHPGKY